jgi:NAD(P)-dependent dehydrogenase (short-subunit alcohol dehydrogenase family)
MSAKWVPLVTDPPPLSFTKLNSGHGGEDLGIGREATDALLRAGNTIVDADVKDAPSRALQGYLRIWPDLADELRRRTGARFIVSLAAVFDFDAHRLPSFA